MCVCVNKISTYVPFFTNTFDCLTSTGYLNFAHIMYIYVYVMCICYRGNGMVNEYKLLFTINERSAIARNKITIIINVLKI